MIGDLYENVFRVGCVFLTKTQHKPKMSDRQVETRIDTLPSGYSNYLKVALDPYHDKAIRFEGAPTSRSAPTVTLCLNQEMTLSANDFSNITDDTWDAHFAMYPFLNRFNVSPAQESNAATHAAAIPNFETSFFPMMVHGVNSGTPTFCTADYTDPLDILGLDGQSLVYFQTSDATNNGPGRRCLRIVGEAFEVVNESPDIYTQGAVTTYRYPIDVTPANRILRIPVNSGNNVNPYGPFPLTDAAQLSTVQNVYDLRCPPSNQAVAVLVQGADTWKAKEGAYVVGTQYMSEVPFKTVDNTSFVFTGYTPTAGPVFTGSSAFYSWMNDGAVHNFQGGAESFVLPAPTNPNAAFPYNLSGAYFTGLSKQFTALRLRYRLYVEILTDPSDNTLAPLGTPSLPYDQNLQQFIMKVIADSPSGVAQTMNPKGEKWRMILKSIGTIAKTSAPVMDKLLPGMGRVLEGGGELAQGVSKIGKKKKATTKPLPKPSPKLIAKS